MERRSMVALMLFILMLALGCNPRVGLIALDTNPQGATVYLNEVKLGETPVKFEFNTERPATLRILKEGYHPKTEYLNVGWVKSEYHKGHYGKGEYMIGGHFQRGFEVRTILDLMRADGQSTPESGQRSDRTASPASPSPSPQTRPSRENLWRELTRQQEQLNELRKKNLITDAEFQSRSGVLWKKLTE